MKKGYYFYSKRIASISCFSAYVQLKPAAIAQLNKHLLDAAGSMLYAIKAPIVEKFFRQA